MNDTQSTLASTPKVQKDEEVAVEDVAKKDIIAADQTQLDGGDVSPATAAAEDINVQDDDVTTVNNPQQRETKSVYKVESYKTYGYEVTNKHSFAEYQLSDYADAFKMYDVMGDGVLSVSQCLRALSWLGENPPTPQYNVVVNEVDFEGKDQITFQKMLDIISHFSRPPMTEIELLETFELMDQDHSGTVDAGELKRLMTCVGHALTTEEAEAMIAEADNDCSGEVDFDEFSHTILSSQY